MGYDNAFYRWMLPSPVDTRFVKHSRESFSTNLGSKPRSPKQRGALARIIPINHDPGDACRNSVFKQCEDPILGRSQKLTPLFLGPPRFGGQCRAKYKRVSRESLKANMLEDLPIVFVQFSDRVLRHRGTIPTTFRGRLIGRTAGSEPVNRGSNPFPEANSERSAEAIRACLGSKYSQVQILPL